MEAEGLRRLLESVRAGDCSVEEAAEVLQRVPVADMGFARLDGHRSLRKGFPEVVYCPGKTAAEVAAILSRLREHHPRVLATRAEPELAAAVCEEVPQAAYHARPRMLTLGDPPAERVGGVCVVTAGTADRPAAEEAALSLEFMGAAVERIFDVGVAGLHRLLGHLDSLTRARAIVVAAGMDGALASVVGGLVRAPVVAVPTSVGYGASFGGLAALLTMLNSCAPGVAVVNIDNGFGAACMAAAINRREGP